MRLRNVMAVALFFCCSAAIAEKSPKLPLPNEVRRFSGAVNLYVEGRTVFVAFSHTSHGLVETMAHVELREGVTFPLALQTDAAEILHWNGHLLILDKQEGRAIHLSVSSFSAAVGLPLAENGTSIELDPAGLNAFLQGSYQLIDLDSAVEIGFQDGSLPKFLIDDETAQAKWLRQAGGLRNRTEALNSEPYQPDLGGGSGGGSSCTQTCNGSQCSVSCQGGSGTASCTCKGSPMVPTCTCG